MYNEAVDALHESWRRVLNTSEYLLRSGESKVLRRDHECEKAMQKENEAVVLASSGRGRRWRRTLRMRACDSEGFENIIVTFKHGALHRLRYLTSVKENFRYIYEREEST